MSLLTRCHACHMVFHVVQDQLKVSEGWVRCGRCGEVFNALDHLFEADAPSTAGSPTPPSTDSETTQHTDFSGSTLVASDFGPLPGPSRQPPTWDLPPLAEPPPVPMVTAIAVPVPALTVLLPQPPVIVPQDVTQKSQPAEEPHSSAAASATEPTAEAAATPPSPSSPPPEASTVDTASNATPTPAPQANLSVPPAEPTPSTEESTTVHPVPGFLQDPMTHWYHRTWARWLMALMVPILLLALGLQILIQYRNDLSTNYTGLRGYLLKMCSVVGCQLESPRMLDQLVLVSSKIQQTSAKNVLHLRAELHNRARHPVRTPSLDLTLTDAYGQVLVRKVMHPQELRSPGESIKGSNSWQISAFVDVGTLPVAGFSLVLFYP